MFSVLYYISITARTVVLSNLELATAGMMHGVSNTLLLKQGSRHNAAPCTLHTPLQATLLVVITQVPSTGWTVKLTASVRVRCGPFGNAAIS
jgi:hypothetical protein